MKTLNSNKIAVDFKNVADEIVANLRAADGTTGFEDGEVRSVSENARTLKFDQSGLGES